MGNTVASAVLVAVACFGLQLQLPAWWASGTQISGKHLGALIGLMNMIGNLGAAVLQTLFGYFVEAMKSQATWAEPDGTRASTSTWASRWWGWCAGSLIDPGKTVEDGASGPCRACTEPAPS